MNFGVFSLVPVVLTLALAFLSRSVILALLSGLLSGGFILRLGGESLFSGIECIATVFQNDWSVKAILFALLTGAFVHVIEASGGVNGFVTLLTEKRHVVRSRMGAEALAYFLGMSLFIDGISSIVVSGVSSKPFFDRYNGSRGKLAYILDSTSAPVAFLSPITAAGALITALLGVQVSEGVISGEPFGVVLRALPFQLYCILSVLIVGITVFAGKPMPFTREVPKENIAVATVTAPVAVPPMALNMLLPLAFFVLSIFWLLYASGGGDILKGDGSTAIFTGISLTLIATGLFYVVRGVVDARKYIDWCIKGMASYLEIALILTLSFALSGLLNSLGTGAYLASIGQHVEPAFVPVMVFLSGALISFMTGTSGGTLSILVPIMIPLAAALGVTIPLVLGAAISGAVFGDHCSPISDSTILASMVAEVEVMDHVRSQMPYALIGGGISAVMFLALGVMC